MQYWWNLNCRALNFCRFLTSVGFLRVTWAVSCHRLLVNFQRNIPRYKANTKHYALNRPIFTSPFTLHYLPCLLNRVGEVLYPWGHIFNARAQRSCQRRLWDRPRTPSSSPLSSWRLQRWDTIRARITKFGTEVELDERYSHTKFDVTGYFRSPASGHFVTYLSNFTVQYLRNGWT